jgi:iron complex outermembrane recepter protein
MFLNQFYASVLLAAAGALVVPAYGENGQEPAVGAAVDLGVVEVIGQRKPAALELTQDVISASTIAAQHRDDLAQALELVPGLSLQNLGQRRERLLFLRGFSSRQVPLFIDGVPVYVPYDGNVDLSRFGVDSIAEIHVGKGLASLLYGPNILGGAVNVISRRPQQGYNGSARVSTEADSDFNSTLKRAAMNASFATDRWYGILGVSGSSASGYRLPTSFQPVAAENGGRRENADSRDSLITLRVGFAPTTGHEYGLNYYRQEGEKQDPPYAGNYLRTGIRTDGVQVRFWRWPYWDKESLSITSKDSVGTSGTLRIRAYVDQFRNSLDSFDDATFTTQNRPFAFRESRYNDYSYGGSAEFEWSWTGAQTTRLAAHYKRDVHREQQLRPVLPEQRLDIPTWDIAVEHEWRITEALSLTPSYQHVIQSGSTVSVFSAGQFSPITVAESTANNAQLVATWRVTEGGSIVGGVSGKTRFPTLKERFSGGLGSVVPNSALEPETAQHIELGYEQHGSNWNAKASLFHSRLRDAIESITVAPISCTSPPCTQQRNVGRQRNRGLELSVDYAPITTLSLAAQLGWLDRDNQSSPGIVVTGTPAERYRLAADWQFMPQWRLRTDWQHETRRYSNSTGTRFADGFTLVNSFVRFAPGTNWGFELGGRNLTNKLYAYEEGFYEAGRSWLLQVDWKY